MLALSDEFVLLTLRDEGGDFVPMPWYVSDSCFAGTALMELALRDRIDTDLEKLILLDRAPIGQDAADTILERIFQPGFDVLMATVIDQLAPLGPVIRNYALEHLCKAGVLARHDKKVLWLFNSRRYPIAEGKEIREAKLRLLGILLADDLPDARDACLLSLLSVSGILEQLVPPSEFNKANERMEQLASLDLIARSVRDYIATQRMNVEMAILSNMPY
jgi:golgi phosphoprotein 3